MSYAIVLDQGPIQWFVSPISRVTPAILAHFSSEGDDDSSPLVEIHPYEEMETYIKNLIQNLAIIRLDESDVFVQGQTKRILMDPAQVNWRLQSNARRECDGTCVRISDIVSPIAKSKSIKNHCELNGMRACHIRDGVALTAFFSWLSRHMHMQRALQDKGGVLPTEHQAARLLATYREKMSFHVSPSFDTISSYGANGMCLCLYLPSLVSTSPSLLSLP